MPAKPLPPVELLRSLYDYDPETGLLMSHRTSRPIGRRGVQGYLTVVYRGSCYRVARIAWKMMTGEDPAELIDHVNGVRDDDRWVNLREVTHRQNSQNRCAKSNNTTGLKGVTHDSKRTGLAAEWQASIWVDGRRKYLGIYPTAEAAHAAYKAAASKFFGVFSRF